MIGCRDYGLQQFLFALFLRTVGVCARRTSILLICGVSVLVSRDGFVMARSRFVFV